MINLIETCIRYKYRTWTAYEKETGITAKNGKRRIVFLITKLSELLEPLGLQIKIISNEFPVSLAEKLSVVSPYSSQELEGIIGFTIAWYSTKMNPITEHDPRVREKVNLAIEYSREHLVSLFDAIVIVTGHFYKP